MLLKRIFITLSAAAIVTIGVKALKLFDGEMTADPAPPVGGEVDWPAWQSPPPATRNQGKAVAGLELAALRSKCFSKRPTAEDCELLSALTTDDAVRADALRAAARQHRAARPKRADELLMLAATSNAQALVDYGKAPARSDEDGEVRVEALVEAARAGQTETAKWLAKGYGLGEGEAITRPEWAALLLHGHAHAIPDTTESRRWLYSVGSGMEAACPFEHVLFDTASYKRSKQRFAAGLAARTQDGLARSALTSVGHFVGDFARFGHELARGDGYVEAADRLFNGLRHENHRLDHVSAIGTEAGARDSVRLVQLVQGCNSAAGVRLTTNLTALYRARAGQSPTSSPGDSR